MNSTKSASTNHKICFTGLVLFFSLFGNRIDANVGHKNFSNVNNLPVTNIQGVINDYSIVTEITKGTCTDKIRTNNSTYYAVDDRVLIIQMKGANISLENTVNFGNINTIENTGNYEFATILNISGNVIALKEKLIHAYTPANLVQLVRVPVYDQVNVVGPLTCQPWDGSTGGILAFECAGAVSLSANITVSKKGFKGGDLSLNQYTCNYFTYYEAYPSYTSGQKGEGIAQVSAAFQSARGKLANGGGGGNQTNAGGGGGGNYSRGGRGGDEWGGCGQDPIGGEAGIGLGQYYNSGRLFLGAGGGGGHQNNSYGSMGGYGGGIILISAMEIVGNGFNIEASGESTNASGIDGAGGAGGGGSILIACPTWSGNVHIQVSGGNGGNAKDNHGPGGGGGGGFIGLSTPGLPAGVSIDLSEGLNGVNNINAWGAEPGISGGILFGQILASAKPPEPVMISLGTKYICEGDSTLIFGKYESESGDYFKLSPVANGCDSLMTITLAVYAPLILNSIQKNSCPGENNGSLSILVNGGNPPYHYHWAHTMENIPYFEGLLPGNYSVTITDQNGCNTIENHTIETQEVPSYKLEAHPIVCFGGNNAVITLESSEHLLYSIDSINFSAEGNFDNLGPGIYSIYIQDEANCINDTTVQVSQPAEWDLFADHTFFELNFGEQVKLNTHTNAAHLEYHWIPSEGLNCNACPSPIATPSEPTHYLLIAEDPLGCKDSISIDIQVLFRCNNLYIPNIFSPNDDGINDFFEVAVGNPDEIKIRGLNIFDRWGSLVFSDQSIDPTWTGLFNNKELPPGVYTYLLTYTCQEDQHSGTRQKKGDVTILR